MRGRDAATDLVLVGGGLAALILGKVPLLILMIVLSVIATGEAYRLARASGATPVAILGLAGTVALLLVAHQQGEEAPTWFAIVLMAVLLLGFTVLIVRRRRQRVTEGLAFTLVPLLAIGLLAAYLVALRSAREGFRVVLALVAMAVINDLVSGLVDPRRGKRVIAPGLRPSRTWEGLAAGAVATLVVAVILAIALNETFSWRSALLLGLIVSAAAPVGDLSRAMFERDLRADAGVTVPRAVVWRRIDGLLFSSPMFFYAFRLLER